MSRPPRELFRFFSDNGVANFVETGSFHGGGVSWALTTGFTNIHSIESAREFHEECKLKFAREMEQGLVSLHLGDSGEVLPEVVRSLSGPALYWLDAHFQGVEAEFSVDNCPLDKELAAIISRGHGLDVIFIDDLRLLEQPKAWRGHDVVIDKSMGNLIRRFPEHVAMRLDGHVPRDVFALVPLAFASGFLAQFPHARSVERPSPPVTVDFGEDRPPIVVTASGHNARIGNLLPLYGRLVDFGRTTERSIVFPWVENIVDPVFDWRAPPTPTPPELGRLLTRIMRSAEEIVEQREGVEPFKYAEGQVNSVDFDQLRLRCIFGRGRINWGQNTNAFRSGHTIVLKDPFPFNNDVIGLDESISNLTGLLDVRPSLLAEALADRAHSGPGDVDVCLHIRQGDFRRWANGDYWYEPEVLEPVIGVVRAWFTARDMTTNITLISDEPLPQSLFEATGTRFVSGSIGSDFVRMTVADVVLSNSSTFSQTAAAVGRVFNGLSTQWMSIGKAATAVAKLDRDLSTYVKPQLARRRAQA